jgi:hypothetical protein
MSLQILPPFQLTLPFAPIQFTKFIEKLSYSENHRIHRYELECWILLKLTNTLINQLTESMVHGLKKHA